jgi:hypothetical protein
MHRAALDAVAGIMQISQAATCNRLHNIEERTACWLLMTHDRGHSDKSHLLRNSLARC